MIGKCLFDLEGSNGSVYRAQYQTMDVACKFQDNPIDNIGSEFEIMFKLRHANIALCYGFCEYDMDTNKPQRCTDHHTCVLLFSLFHFKVLFSSLFLERICMNGFKIFKMDIENCLCKLNMKY